MQRPAFKKIQNKLAFNNPGADPIFLIVQEVEDGFMYMLETTPFGTVSFVHRGLVSLEEDEEVKTEEPTDGEHKSTTRKG